MSREMKFKIGDKISISSDYYIEKKELDLPFFGVVVNISDDGSRVKIKDDKNINYTVDTWYIEKDNINTLKDCDTDTENDGYIKNIMRIIATQIGSRNLKAANEAEDVIGGLLFDSVDNKERMNNEIIIQKALAKYKILATRKMESEREENEFIYRSRSKKFNRKVNVMEDLLNTLGVFEEMQIDKFETQRNDLAKSSNAKKEESIEDMLSKLFSLKMLESMIKEMDDEDEDEDSHILFGNLFGGNESVDDEEKDEKEDKHLPGQGPNFLTGKKPKKKIPDCLIDMTDLAARGKYNDIIGREDEIDTVAETLARKEIRNPLLIGKPGAGKTAVVEELVKRSYNGQIEHLKNKHFYELRMNDLVAGTMYRGQLEEKLQSVMKVLENDPNVVLFIDEVHMIVQAGSTSEDKNDVANALKPYLTSEISIIGATTFDEYKATLEGDGALARRFNPIIIEEKTKEEVVEIVNTVKERFELYHNVELSEDMIRQIVNEIERSNIDNSLIAGTLSAVDTICTKMKIKHLTEEEAFDKWSSEVVLGVNRTNRGGKTGKIGFNVDRNIKEEKNISGNSPKDITDEELDSLVDGLKDDKLKIIPTKEEYFELTGDDTCEGYEDYLTKYLEIIIDEIDIVNSKKNILDEEDDEFIE